MNAREPDAGTTPVLAIEGPRATIRLNRPRQLNKITPEDIAALLEQLDEVGRDDAHDRRLHDPHRAKRYRDGDHDYDDRYGSRDVYSFGIVGKD